MFLPEAFRNAGSVFCVCAQLYLTLLPFCYPMDGSPPGFPGKNTGVGCHALFQGIFLTQGSNQSLLHWQSD